MDPRVRDHAETLVNWSARIEAGDDVVVQVDEGAHDLAVAVAEQLGEQSANHFASYMSDEVNRAYLRAFEGEFEEDPDYVLSLYEQADSVLVLRAKRNTVEGNDVPADRRQALSQSRQAIREATLDTDWVATLHPTRSLAQQAEMSYGAYQDFVYDAVLRDWEALAKEMAQLKEILDDGSEVRIRKESDGTDVSMSIANRNAINSAASVAYDSHNLPSGEVFTAPENPEGAVTFDIPMTIRNRRVRDVRLVFEDGEVVDWSAVQGEDAIAEVVETDEGARRLGELGIGMNRGIDRPTDTILFDEKMGGTIHLALGRAYEDCLPAGEQGNQSAVHTDLITDMRETGTELLVDGETIQRNGTFRWEDGFDA